ncbi:NAD(P)-dependent oxidoreductase [Alginatibacterium sediminis]|nr:NAD(P)-dependent oxidoreductase [Alginatibacterium sediminis]
MRVAFVGLGTMGYPMAGHLLASGFEVCVYNRSADKSERWLAEHPRGEIANTPREAAMNADVVLSCVGNDDDVRSVYYGDDGIFADLNRGAICVDHTTASASLAKELAAAAKQLDCGFLDGPVSGGEAGAINGVLTVMMGGEQVHFDKVEPVLKAFSKAVTLVGEHGAGQVCKMANQLCIAGVLQGLSEGLKLAQSAGLDIETVQAVLKHGAAGSWQLENRALTMAKGEFDFGFAIDWMRKDLSICFEQAVQLNVELPLAKQVDQRYAQLQERGFSRSDTSVLIKQFDQDQHA